MSAAPQQAIWAAKKQLRSLMGGALKALNADTIRDESKRVTELLLSLPEYKEATSLCLYLSMEGEFQTRELVRDALLSKTVFVPRVVDKEHMVMLQVFSVSDVENLAKSKWGIPEPDFVLDGRRRVEACDIADPLASALSLVVVPAVAFDAQRRRLGHGRGYYDRYLAALSAARARSGLSPVKVRAGWGGGRRGCVDPHSLL